MFKKTAIAVAVAFFASGIASAQEETITHTYNGSPLFIAQDDADVFTLVRIPVNRALRISKVTVRLQIGFDRVGDLDVFLYSPAGTRTKLLEGNCGDLRNIDTTFDDAASSRFSDFCPAEAGRGPYRGNEPLANSAGQVSYGLWRLAVENNESSRTGWITAFSITITGTRIATPTISGSTIVNAASLGYAEGVAPGELVSIFGVALGPAAGVSAPSTGWPTSLGGTSVTVNGTMVPVAFASTYRVDVQMPYTLGSEATVVVNAGGQASPAVTLPVYSARPGIYTSEWGGTGAVKAVNQDGTRNSKATPAAKGSTITIYASGLGNLQPPLTAGQPPPLSPLSNTVQTVSAWIGGVPASVRFAGGAPNLTGISQLNIDVDPSTASGTRELSISVGGIPSQTDTFVEIR